MKNSTPKSDWSAFVPDSPSTSVEETLRWLAHLPAPTGLEDRVLAKLESAPRPARVQAWFRLAWPNFSRYRSFQLEDSWLCSAAVP